MAQEKECHDFEDETIVETDGKSATKSQHVQVTQPSKDLNRYLVDKFHLPATKSKNAPFETIDLSIYRPSAKCLAFSTSEDRLLLQYVAQYPDGTSIRTLETKTQFLRRPFQFSVNEIFRMKAEHFSFKMKVLAT